MDAVELGFFVLGVLLVWGLELGCKWLFASKNQESTNKSSYTLLAYTDNKQLAKWYQEHDCQYKDDDGCDLFIPKTEYVPPFARGFMIDLQVRCKPLNVKSGYFLIPRSSISKTPLRMSNSIGLIDAGYRDTLKVAVDNVSGAGYLIEVSDKKPVRLFQLVSKTQAPLKLQWADHVDQVVGEQTDRMFGGFGSTDDNK